MTNTDVQQLMEAVQEVKRELADHKEQHRKDMEELRPYMQALAGFGIIYKLLMIVGSGAGAWLAIKTLWPTS